MQTWTASVTNKRTARIRRSGLLLAIEVTIKSFPDLQMIENHIPKIPLVVP